MIGFPIVLMGSDYWGGLLDWIRGTVAHRGMIGALDADLLRLTDDPDEAVEIVVERSAELRAQEEATVRANAQAEQAAAENAGW